MEEKELSVPFELLLELKKIMTEKGFAINIKLNKSENAFYFYEPNANEPFASLVYDKKEFENDNTQNANTRTRDKIVEYPQAFIERVLGIIRARSRRSGAESRESGARIATSEERENRSRAVVEGSESLVQESGFLQGISDSNLWRGNYQQNPQGIQQLKQLKAQGKELLNNVALRAYLKNSSDEYSIILEERIFYHQKQSFIKKAKDYNKRKHIFYPDAKEKSRIELIKEYLELAKNPLFNKKPFRSKKIKSI
ncbi:MAG: hypothetical protein J1E31_03420 [Helicobacter sp.]|nr:hypothetical protein [Helicobacter sp.]